MSATRLHRPTAILLAVLYGVVGLAGESLHYLLTDPALVWSSMPSGESGGYYHTHAPDYHGHFHRHEHHAHHEHHSHVAVRNTRQPTDEPALTSDLSTHEPHACPLLAVVSTLKLGHAGCCTAATIDDSLITPTFERGTARALAMALHPSARGPPGRSLA